MLKDNPAARKRAEQVRDLVNRDMLTSIEIVQDAPFQLVRYYAPELDIYVSVPMEWMTESRHAIYDVSLFVSLAMRHHLNKSKQVG